MKNHHASGWTNRDISAREYKVMLRARLFRRRSDLARLERDLRDVADSLGMKAKGKFRNGPSRTIEFFDTSDHSLYKAGMILRQRRHVLGKGSHLTLKAISPDRYIARACDVAPARSSRSTTKFEEDVCPPFSSRFSLSTTTRPSRHLVLDGLTPRFDKAVALFPSLRKLADGWAERGPLSRVNGWHVLETVLHGPAVHLGEVKATMALILWKQRSNQQPFLVELSFRYQIASRGITPATARNAYLFYQAIQGMKWSDPRGTTKTKYVYGKSAKKVATPVP